MSTLSEAYEALVEKLGYKRDSNELIAEGGNNSVTFSARAAAFDEAQATVKTYLGEEVRKSDKTLP